MGATRHARSRAAAAVAAGLVGAVLLTGCGSVDDGSAGEGSGGGSEAEPVEVTSTGLPDDFVAAVLLGSGDELLALAPRGDGRAEGETEDTGAADGGEGGVALEIVAYRSTDAETWTEQGVVTGLDLGGDEYVSGGAAATGGLVLVGGAFGEADRTTPLALSSTDGLEWQRVPEAELAGVRDLSAVTRDGGGFLAVGRSPAFEPVPLRSDDGGSWREADVSGLEVAGGSETVQALASTGEAFVAFGLTECDDCSDDDVAVAWTSPDGTDWAQTDLGPLAEALDEANSDLVPVVVGTPSGFVAIVEGSDSGDPPSTWLSEDGSQWRRGPSLDVPDDADYLSAAALGDDAVVLLAVDNAPVLRRISPSS